MFIFIYFIYFIFLFIFICFFFLDLFFYFSINILVLNSLPDFYLNKVLSVESSLSSLHFFYFCPEIVFLIIIFSFVFFSLFRVYESFDLWRFWQFFIFYFILFYFCWVFIIVESSGSVLLFNNMVIFDFYSTIIKLFILGLFFILFYFFFLYSKITVDCSTVAIQIVLLGFICWLLLLLSSTFHFFVLYIVLEALTFSLVTLYIITSSFSFSVEAALKYYYLNAIASAFILLSLLVLHFGLYSFDFLLLKIQLFYTNSSYNLFFLNYFFIFFFFGFMFKLSAFPCSFWAPDVYEGLNFPMLFLFAVILKVAYLSIFLRICIYLIIPNISIWYECFLFASFGSILWGGFGAIFQTKVKRFFSYTSINQIGFLLLAFTAFSSIDGIVCYFFYLSVYVVASCFFFLSILTNPTINYLTGVTSVTFLSDLIKAFQSPHSIFSNEQKTNKFFFYELGASSIFFSLSIFIFSGLPPFIGFFSKFFLFFVTFQNFPFILVFLILFSTVVSLFYYLRLLKLVWFDTKLNFLSNYPGVFTGFLLSSNGTQLNTVNKLNNIKFLISNFYVFLVNIFFFVKKKIIVFSLTFIVLVAPLFTDFFFINFYWLATYLIAPFSSF